MTALLQVLMVDLVLAGDNAIVVGMAVAGLPAAIRTRAIFLGIAAAAVLRIIFSLMTVQLLSITGLVLAGGVLLLWVCWKMYREIMEQRAERKAAEAIEEATDDLLSENGHKPAETEVPTKTLRQALIQIILADVSMSLDNVLAVAGAARHHEMIMVIGLAVSVILMAVASTFIARLLSRFHWIAYIGLAMIGYIALKMIYDGSFEVLPLIGVK
ncbi:hypothetical protein CHR90_07880 [Elstera cyanobacteriorum]|uniref:Tellurium resistance protein TerC n=2 Tax=Elstera cyanobacteriorum TaxID=2022747 RepID=A0A255XSW0_9PROT|nr:TerC family protein [Elstera cyanobacteriorum]OYQ19340.1 hypothetical protein CHR90_07880 [Elstera cyanobacteriorum]